MSVQKPVRPGESITVSYAGGELECKAPNFETQRKILVQWEKLANGESTALERCDAVIEAFNIACPDVDDETKSKLNNNDLAEIVTNFLKASSVGGELAKKSE